MDFNDIYDVYFERVYRFIRAKTPDKMVAEDICVKVFENIYRKLETYSDEKGSLDLWIFTIARNEIASFYRSNRIQTISMDHVSEGFFSTSSTEEMLINKSRNLHLASALEKLNENERFAVISKYCGGLKNTEIGELLGISSSNVGVVLFRSMKKLRKELEEEYEKR